MVQMPFEQLPSGVSYREYRAGTGDAGEYILCMIHDTHITLLLFILL